MKQNRAKHKRSTISRQQVYDALPGTALDVFAKVDLCQDTVRRIIRELRESGDIYISKWLNSNKSPSAYYDFGVCADAEYITKKASKAKKKNVDYYKNLDNIPDSPDDTVSESKAKERGRAWADKAANGEKNTWYSLLFRPR